VAESKRIEYRKTGEISKMLAGFIKYPEDKK
jgi:hypothetical protein